MLISILVSARRHCKPKKRLIKQSGDDDVCGQNAENHIYIHSGGRPTSFCNLHHGENCLYYNNSLYHNPNLNCCLESNDLSGQFNRREPSSSLSEVHQILHLETCQSNTHSSTFPSTSRQPCKLSSLPQRVLDRMITNPCYESLDALTRHCSTVQNPNPPHLQLTSSTNTDNECTYTTPVFINNNTKQQAEVIKEDSLLYYNIPTGEGVGQPLQFTSSNVEENEELGVRHFGPFVLAHTETMSSNVEEIEELGGASPL